MAMPWRPGYLARRTLGRISLVFRAVPSSVFISVAAMTLAFIPLLGNAWAPFTTPGSIVLISWGGWRGARRVRALNGFRPWKP
jgi:hypothetical protein